MQITYLLVVGLVVEAEEDSLSHLYPLLSDKIENVEILKAKKYI